MDRNAALSPRPPEGGRRPVRTGERGSRNSGDASGGGWKTLIRWSVTIVLVGILLAVADVRSVVGILSGADPLLLAVALVVAAADRALMIGKWIPLVRVLVPDVGVLPAARAYLAASFASLFLPSSVGGDAVRAYAIGREHRRITEVAVSILVERVLGFLGLALVAAGALLLAARTVPEAARLLPWVLGVGAAGVVLLVLPVVFGRGERHGVESDGWWGKVRSLWERILAGYRRYADHPRMVTAVGGLSTLEQLFPVGIIWLLARALDVPAGLTAVALATPLSMFLMRLPIAIDGIGLVEGALVYFLGLFGIGADQALAIAVANRAVTTLVILPGAAFVSDVPADGESAVADVAAGLDAPDLEDSLAGSSTRPEGVSSG